MSVAHHTAQSSAMMSKNDLPAKTVVRTTGLIFFFLSEKKMLKTKGLFRP